MKLNYDLLTGISSLTGVIPVITYLYNESVYSGIAIAVIINVIITVLLSKAPPGSYTEDPEGADALNSLLFGALLFGIGGYMKYHDSSMILKAIPVGFGALLISLYMPGITKSVLMRS